MNRHEKQSPRVDRGTPLPVAALLGIVAAIALLVPASPAIGQEETWGENFTRTAHVEGQVTVQRASEIESEEALLNMPIVPGDRLWTGADGRAELQLADGMILRLDHASKLDAVSLGLPGDAEQDVTLLRLWSGSAILRGGIFQSDSKAFQLDTTGASVFILEDGLYRVDVDAQGTTVVSAYRGLAEVVARDSSVLVRGGQRTVIESGYAPEEPFSFNSAELDDFGAWSDERDLRYSSNPSADYVDPSIAQYTNELTDYGNWVYVSTYDSYLWRPYVGYGWSPYYYGYWNWYPWGYYWYSWEPWSWACYHYGRWSWVPGYGWCWYPGNRWSGGWVWWGVGNDYVGWVPRDPYDRPATLGVDGTRARLDRAARNLQVSREGSRTANLDAAAWTFVRPEALASREPSRHLLSHEQVAVREPMKMLSSPPVVDFRERLDPAAALGRIYHAPGFSGGRVTGISTSSLPTASGRRYEMGQAVTPPRASAAPSRPATVPAPGAIREPGSSMTSRPGGSGFSAPRQPASTPRERPATTAPRPPSGRSSPEGVSSPPSRSDNSYSRRIYSGIGRPPAGNAPATRSRDRAALPPLSGRQAAPPRSAPATRPQSPPRSTPRYSTPPARPSAPPPRSVSPSGGGSRSAPPPSRPASPPSGGGSKPSGKSPGSSKGDKK